MEKPPVIDYSSVDMTDAVLLLPKNDEESLLIGDIAATAGIPMVVSDQPHGARLHREERLIERLRAASAIASTVVIVEIPDPSTEDELRAQGWKVIIVDHHVYEGLDRLAPKSSLEQFLDVFGITDDRLVELGFDPFLVRGVGALDQGFVYELAKRGITGDDKRRVISHYLSLTNRLGARLAKAAVAAEEAFATAEMRNGVQIIRSAHADVHIRSTVSFLIIAKYDVPPPTVILEGSGAVSVQDSERALTLFEKYGGYVFGGGRCWGRRDGDIPSLDEILAIITP